MAAEPEGCPCPLERTVLINTMGAIVQELMKDPKLSRAMQGSSKASSSSEALVPYVPGAVQERALHQCKSQELNGGKFYNQCICLKRDGLQHECPRSGCSPRCGLVAPAQRTPVSLGTAVQGMRHEPRCDPGRLQVERDKYLLASAEKRKRRPPSPPLPPVEEPPPPPYNWRGWFPHQCRSCEPRPRPAKPKMPCGGPACKHWAPAHPCTLPICRAECFEPPPPKKQQNEP